MPPVAPRLHEDALSLVSAIEGRFQNLFEVEIPRLRQCSGPLSLHQAFSEEIREETLVLSKSLDDLDLMVDDQSGERNRKHLRGIVDGFRSQLGRLRHETRAALLASKRTIDSLGSKANRDELFAMTPKTGSAEEQTTDNLIAKTNSDITDALRRTVALMQSELERSVLASQMLDESTKSLRSTSTQHDTLSNVMYTSKQLITALEKADWLDRMLIFSGFGFFILVVLFIVKQRIVDRSLRIAFFWTRFIPSFGDDEKLLRNLEEGVVGVAAGVTSTVVVVASSLATAIAAHSSSIVETVTSDISSATTLSSSISEDILFATDTSSSAFSTEPSSTTEDQPSSSETDEPPIHVEL